MALQSVPFEGTVCNKRKVNIPGQSTSSFDILSPVFASIHLQYQKQAILLFISGQFPNGQACCPWELLATTGLDPRSFATRALPSQRRAAFSLSPGAFTAVSNQLIAWFIKLHYSYQYFPLQTSAGKLFYARSLIIHQLLASFFTQLPLL